MKNDKKTARSRRKSEALQSSTATNPTPPTILMRETSYTAMGAMRQFALSQSGKFAYVARFGNAIFILDVTDIQQPILLSSLSTEGTTNWVATLSGNLNTLIVADGSAGIMIIDIANISSPILVSNVLTRGSARFVTTLEQHHNMLAVANDVAGIALVDIANISNPVLVSNMPLTGSAYFITTLKKYPNLLVVAAAGVAFINITNIARPVVISYISITGIPYCIRILEQYPNLLAVGSSIGVALIDVTNISQPILVSNLLTAGGVWSITTLAQQPNLLAVADATAGISLVDITDIFHPFLLSNTQIIGAPSFVTTLEEYPNLLMVASAAGLHIIEISYMPVLQINSIKLKNAFKTLSKALSIATLAKHPNVLAVADEIAGITLIDITDISQPVLISNMSMFGTVYSVITLTHYPNLLVVVCGATNVVYLGMDFTIGGRDILLFDITSISYPVLVSNISVSAPIFSMGALAQFPNLFFVFTTGSMAMISVAETFSLALVAVIPLVILSSTEIAHYHNVVAVVQTNGIFIVDVTDIFHSRVITQLALTGANNYVTMLAQYPNLLTVSRGADGIALIDITDINNIVLTRSIPTAGYASSIMPLPQNPNLIMVADGAAGISIMEINSLALWDSYLPTQMVGQNIIEGLLVYKTNPCELLQPDKVTVTVQQIGADRKKRIDIPYWLSLNRETLTLNGIPPKEVTGQHFAIEVSFNSNSTLTGIYDNYKPLFFFDVVSSLNLRKITSNYTLLNQTSYILPTLAIDSLSQLVTLTLTASPATNIQFIITDDFGPIRPTFNQGVLQAFGATPNFNVMLKRLRYSPLNPSAVTGTTVNIGLNDNGLNHPITSYADMSFFRANYPPVCSKDMLEVKFETNFNLDYTISPYSCVDVDDSLDGLSLRYSASALPTGLTFVASQMRFSGIIIPPLYGSFFVNVTATDSYATDILTFRFVRAFNQPPRVTKSIQKLLVTTGSILETTFSPADFFTDPDGDYMTITFSGIPNWLTITPASLIINNPAINSTSSFSLIARPGPVDTNSFSNYDGSITVQVSDLFNGTTTTLYTYTVTGDSVVKLISTYGGIAISILGAIYAFYAYRVQLFNACAWDRYRVKHEQFGQSVEAFNLFAVKGEIESHGTPGTSRSQHHAETIGIIGSELMEELAVITRWSDRMGASTDSHGKYYYKHTVFEGSDDAKMQYKEIKSATVSFVHPLPERTLLQRVKAKALNSIPIIFNGSFGRLFSRFGIKMNPDYFAVFEPAELVVVGGFPSWLKYIKATKTVRVIDADEDCTAYFNTPIVLRLMGDGGSIMEELKFVVRDEALFATIFPDHIDSHEMQPLSGVDVSADSPAAGFAGRGISLSEFAPAVENSVQLIPSFHLVRRARPSTSGSQHTGDLSRQAARSVADRRHSYAADTTDSSAAVVVPVSVEGGLSPDDEAAAGTSYTGKPDGGFWRRYCKGACDTLLPLRLVGFDVVPHRAVVFDEQHPGSFAVVDDKAGTTAVPVLYRAIDKRPHLVGFVFKQNTVTYIDPENNPMPIMLKEALRSLNPASIEQRLVKEQSYSNNCGGELIEHLAEAITGSRVAEEVVPQFHSSIFERFLKESAGYFVRELNAFANRPIIATHLKHVLYRSELIQMRAILDRYNIEMSIDDALSPKGFRSLALKLHPDKGGLKDDFAFVEHLRTSFAEEVDVKALVDIKVQAWQPVLHKANLAIKTADLTINAVKLYQDPTIDAVKDMAVSGLHLYSMYSGVTSVSLAASAASIGYAYYYAPDHSTGMYAVTTQAAVLGCYMALPTMLAVLSPRLAIAYGIGMTALGMYQVVSGIEDLYQKFYADASFQNNIATCNHCRDVEHDVLVSGDINEH